MVVEVADQQITETPTDCVCVPEAGRIQAGTEQNDIIPVRVKAPIIPIFIITIINFIIIQMINKPTATIRYYPSTYSGSRELEECHLDSRILDQDWALS